MITPQILPFRGLRGINTKKSKTQRGPSESNRSLNGFFDTTGSFSQRRGFRRINTTEIDSGYDINSIYHFENKIITAGGTDLKAIDDSTLVVTDLTTALTGSFFDFEQFIPVSTNYMLATNGQDYAFKYDGTTLTKLSIDRPSSTPSSASGAGGSMTAGTYQLAVTFIRDNGSGELQESNPCDTTSVTIAGNRIVLTSVPVSTDAQVTGRRIYCSRPSGAILYLQGTISDNTTTTYNIDTMVDVLEDDELEYDHDPAPKCYLIEKYKNYIILAGSPEFPDRVYVSKPDKPWYFPKGDLDSSSTSFFSIGEMVKSIKSYSDGVMIFGKNGGIFILTGDYIENFNLIQVKNDQRVTAVADRCTIIQDNWCYFLNTDGYYRTNGQEIQKVSEPISAYFDTENQQDGEFNVYGFSSEFNAVTPVAVFYKPYNQILLWISESNQNAYVNNICFVLGLADIVLEGETITPNYSIYTNFATRCTGIYSVDSTFKYFLTSQSDGFIFKSESGKYDGAQVNSQVTSATSTTLTDSTQSWTVNTYTQLWVTITGGTGIGQSKVILSNTATELTVDSAWTTTPDSSSTFSIGLSWFQYVFSWNSYGNDSLTKRLLYVRPRFSSEGDATVLLSFGYDFTDTTYSSVDEKTIEVSGGSTWDVSEWDVALWDGPTVIDSLVPGTAGREHRWNTVKIEGRLSGQSVVFDGLDKIFQTKGLR